MLNDDAKMVIEFIDGCRGTLMIKDDLHIKMEFMYSALHKVETAIKMLPNGEELYLELEDAVIDTINLAKDTYFEYGDNFAQVRESRFFRKVNEEVS